MYNIGSQRHSKSVVKCLRKIFEGFLKALYEIDSQAMCVALGLAVICVYNVV